MDIFLGTRSFLCRFLLVAALFSLCAQGLVAQSFSLTDLDFELSVLQNEDESLGVDGTLKAGGLASFGSHFNISAGVELHTSNMLYLFVPDKDVRWKAELEVTSMAFEFPFAIGWTMTPVVFMGEYADVASSDFLLQSLKVKMRQPEFLRYGALSVFSNETYTEGVAGGMTWRAETFPVAVAAYAGWNGSPVKPGFNIYAQTAGEWSLFSWNVFAILGSGREESFPRLSPNNVFMAGGLSALVGGDRSFSVYLQAQMLPTKLGSYRNSGSIAARRLHALIEPRYNGRFFAASAAFFVTPVMQEKNVHFLDLEEGILYAGTNIMLEGILPTAERKSVGLNFALFADTREIYYDSYSSWQELLRICVSPFFKMDWDIFTLTVSAFLNMSRITSPVSAGEINLHIEAAL